MNVLRVLTTALRIALTLLVPTSVSAMMDTLWTLTNTLAMVELSKFPNLFYHLISYLDINECSTDTNLCHDNASCLNTDGGYDCECLPGFFGDGFNCSSKPLTITL